MKAGDYFLVALKDNNTNFTFEQKEDKIGFKENIITVPSDSSYNVRLFKEIFDFKATRPSLVSGNKIAFGYEGDYKNMNIQIISDVPKDFQYSIIKDSKSDSLHYFFTPDMKRDSLVFKVSNHSYTDTLTVRLKTLEKDSLTISAVNQSTLKLTEDFVLTANIPFAHIDESKINIIDKDSVNEKGETIWLTEVPLYQLITKPKKNNCLHIPNINEATKEDINASCKHHDKEKIFGYNIKSYPSCFENPQPVYRVVKEDKNLSTKHIITTDKLLGHKRQGILQPGLNKLLNEFVTRKQGAFLRWGVNQNQLSLLNLQCCR